MEQSKLTPIDDAVSDYFGKSVTFDKDTNVIEKPCGHSGSFHLFYVVN